VVKHRAEIAHVEPAFKEVKLNPLAHFEFRSRLLWINGPLSNADIKFTISYLAGTNFWLAFFVPVGSSTRSSNGQSVTGFNRQNAFACRFILVKGKPMKKATVVFSAAAVIAMTTVSIPTPAEARGGWGWGPGIAGGLIAGALIGGLASNAYGYGPGYGYYGGPGPGYGYYGGDAPVYYGGYGHPYYGGYGYNRFKNWGG
jgi:hypothetical protein